MMESNTDKLLYLFEEIKSKINYLEDSLDEISQVKKTLKVNSIDVKAQIHDNISRHLEALRNREIWLLSQVELILHGKEDVLSEKQGELLGVIGGMKKVCELLDQSTGVECLEIFEDQLSELITSVEKLNLSPEVTPGIAFSGQNMDLLESIRTFGRVDHTKNESHIASLLNKMELSERPGNKRKFVTDCGSIENWLLHGKKSHDLSPALSVEKWLTKCKPYSDMDSEMGYSELSDAIDNKWLLSFQKNPNQLNQQLSLAYFAEIKMSDPSKWVRESPKAPELPKTIVGETYSKIAALGNEYWLLYKQEKSKQKNLPSDLGKVHANEDHSKWLKRSTVSSSLTETSTGKAYSDLAATSLNQWLKPKHQVTSPFTGKGDCSDCPSQSGYNDDLESLSDSDWLKVNDLEVVSIENLDSTISGGNKTKKSSVSQEDKSGVGRYNLMLQAQPDDNWLQCSVSMEEKSSISQEDKSGVGRYNLMLQAQPDDNWLQRSASMEVTQSTDPMKTFAEYLTSNDYNKWLAHPSGVSSEICKWLARSSLQRYKSCPETTWSSSSWAVQAV